MASTSSNRTQKQNVGTKSMETEEIVKYMSNLPSYLERGKPVHDRALSFGVLDWGQLEQWQYHQHHHQQNVITTNKYSPSGSNRSSLRSHLNMSPEEISTKNRSRTKTRKNDLHPQDLVESKPSHDMKIRTSSRTKTKGVKKNDLHTQDLFESKSSDDMESFQSASSSSSSKGKMKIQDGTNHPNSFAIKDSYKISDINVSSSKKSDFKTSSNKNRFSFNLKSKLVTSKSTTNILETSENSPEVSKTKPKVKMDLGNCKQVEIDNSPSSLSLSLSRKQALFQVAVKNGRPLFTFSVDDNTDEILAATVKSLTGKDETNSWIYTFFTFQEVKKKKSGWLHHSAKDKTNAYLSNVTAQMKVSNPCNGTTREFVLTSVDSGQPDHEYELAAIVVRFLKKESDDEIQDYFNTTVVLPGGHHSVPRKGEPSPLIERWRSGGRCDCGGWDVGCRLKTLNNKNQPDRRSNPPESFNLFLEGDVINERPLFSLAPINEGIFSVDYNESLSLLHAFSICISVIECRKSSHQTELRTYVAKRVDDDVAPVTYASVPPISPVGRV